MQQKEYPPERLRMRHRCVDVSGGSVIDDELGKLTLCLSRSRLILGCLRREFANRYSGIMYINILVVLTADIWTGYNKVGGTAEELGRQSLDAEPDGVHADQDSELNCRLGNI